ncbi:hypothetical protein BH20VER2_BH20VER2_09230 [soil metagenome]
MNGSAAMNPEPPRRRARPVEFIHRRLSPGGDLGLHLTLGLLVMILGSWAFSTAAQEVGPSGALAVFDQHATEWVQHYASAGLTNAASVVSYFGSVVVLTSFSSACALLLMSWRLWERLLGLALTMLGGSALNVLLKHSFQRARPNWEDPLVTLHTFSFPSAHAMGSTLFYGFLALLLMHHAGRWTRRVMVAISAATVIIAISLTRIYLGAHYLSDVLAAFAAGAAWLAFCWTITETFRRRRARIVAQAKLTTSPRPPPAGPR